MHHTCNSVWFSLYFVWEARPTCIVPVHDPECLALMILGAVHHYFDCQKWTWEIYFMVWSSMATVRKLAGKVRMVFKVKATNSKPICSRIRLRPGISILILVISARFITSRLSIFCNFLKCNLYFSFWVGTEIFHPRGLWGSIVLTHTHTQSLGW